MADKYQSEWTKNGSVKITIPDGPAKGVYEHYALKVDCAGMIFLATTTIADGRTVQLKIKASEHPALVAEIERRDVIKSEEAANRQPSEEDRIAEKMLEAGFEASGNAAGMINRLNRFNGNNF